MHKQAAQAGATLAAGPKGREQHPAQRQSKVCLVANNSSIVAAKFEDRPRKTRRCGTPTARPIFVLPVAEISAISSSFTKALPTSDPP